MFASAELAEAAPEPDAAWGPAARSGAATAPRPGPSGRHPSPQPPLQRRSPRRGRDGAPAVPDAARRPPGRRPARATQVVAHCSACALCEGRKRAVFAPPLPARQT
ncbi:MAG: hypothetical protein U1F00_03975 [Rhodoferax sp.]